MDKIKIIVVEDNIVYCEFVCNLLAREGFRTVQAFHLSTARKLLQQAADGDIVVSDLRLPLHGAHRKKTDPFSLGSGQGKTPGQHIERVVFVILHVRLLENSD